MDSVIDIVVHFRTTMDKLTDVNLGFVIDGPFPIFIMIGGLMTLSGLTIYIVSYIRAENQGENYGKTLALLGLLMTTVSGIGHFWDGIIF